MKKEFLLGLLLVFGTLAIYAGGFKEEEIDAEYAAKAYADRSDWVYEFNQMANKVHQKGLEIEKYEGKYQSDVTSFDEYSYRYKVLLDLGVNRTFIDDRTRQQQIAKLREEREKVSKALSGASGLGL
jgi:hypothetical protein